MRLCNQHLFGQGQVRASIKRTLCSFRLKNSLSRTFCSKARVGEMGIAKWLIIEIVITMYLVLVLAMATADTTDVAHARSSSTDRLAPFCCSVLFRSCCPHSNPWEKGRKRQSMLVDYAIATVLILCVNISIYECSFPNRIIGINEVIISVWLQ